MTTATTYKTLASPAIAEFKDRGSRFLAFAYPVAEVQQVKARVAELKKQHPKANHHCVAYRLGHDGTQYRASDDGEPSGSAGRPMLGQIDSAGFTNVLVVVVRYFGGTLLGVPGLINAYKTVTEMALNAGETIECHIEKDVELSFDYATMGEVLYLLRQCEATIHSQEMSLFCNVKAGIPVHIADSCLQRIKDIRGVTVKEL